MFWMSLCLFVYLWGFPGGSDGKESACNVGNLGLIPGWGRSPGGGHGNSLRILNLVNPTDRGAWWATVHRVTKSLTWLKWLSTHAWTYPIFYTKLSLLSRSCEWISLLGPSTVHPHPSTSSITLPLPSGDPPGARPPWSSSSASSLEMLCSEILPLFHTSNPPSEAAGGQGAGRTGVVRGRNVV